MEDKLSVFVGNLSWGTTDDKLMEFCQQNDMNPIGCRVVFDQQSGRSKGFGYCDFATQEECNKLLDLHGTEMDGREIRTDMSNSAAGKGGNRGGNRGRGRGGFGNSGGFSRGGGGGFGGRGGGQQRSRDQNHDNDTPTDLLMIRNMSYDTTDDTLKAAFPDAKDARVVYERESSRSRGFGFVEFEDVETATKAREEMNGQELDGRPLTVIFAQPKPERQGGGRGGGRGGFN